MCEECQGLYQAFFDKCPTYGYIVGTENFTILVKVGSVTNGELFQLFSFSLSAASM
jgi:hypothetical protein